MQVRGEDATQLFKTVHMIVPASMCYGKKMVIEYMLRIEEVKMVIDVHREGDKWHPGR